MNSFHKKTYQVFHNSYYHNTNWSYKYFFILENSGFYIHEKSGRTPYYMLYLVPQLN